MCCMSIHQQTIRRGIKKIPFTVASKGKKYLGINLIKEMKDLYSESHEKLRTTQINVKTVGCQAHLSMEFSRQECWNGLSFPSPGGLSAPGVELRSPTLQADSLPYEPPGKQMERYALLIEELIVSKFHIPHSNLQIQCNPY